MNNLNSDKESVIKFIKKLIFDLQANIVEMKSEFEKNPST